MYVLLGKGTCYLWSEFAELESTKSTKRERKNGQRKKKDTRKKEDRKYSNCSVLTRNDRRSKLQFSARPSDAMLRKNTPPATESNPDPVPDCGPIWVEFLTDKQFGVGQIRQFAKYTISNRYKTGIMVTHVSLSPAARKSLASVENLAKIECFLEDDLLVNITHHELVPRHVLLSREEKAALLKRYRLKETQLPRILQKDPVARYLGLKRGQVVKIIRVSETAGRYASYRLCV